MYFILRVENFYVNLPNLSTLMMGLILCLVKLVVIFQGNPGRGHLGDGGSCIRLDN